MGSQRSPSRSRLGARRPREDLRRASPSARTPRFLLAPCRHGSAPWRAFVRVEGDPPRRAVASGRQAGRTPLVGSYIAGSPAARAGAHSRGAQSVIDADSVRV